MKQNNTKKKKLYRLGPKVISWKMPVELYPKRPVDFFNFKKFLETMTSKPEVQKYLKDFRQRKNDERYGKEVKACIPHAFQK